MRSLATLYTILLQEYKKSYENGETNSLCYGIQKLTREKVFSKKEETELKLDLYDRRPVEKRAFL